MVTIQELLEKRAGKCDQQQNVTNVHWEDHDSHIHFGLTCDDISENGICSQTETACYLMILLRRHAFNIVEGRRTSFAGMFY